MVPHTGRDVSWSSGDSSLVAIDSTGNITALDLGKTWIFAAADGGSISDSSRVTVVETAVTSNGLVSHWDPCVSHGGQELVDIVGGMNGILGTTTEVEGSDPTWEPTDAFLTSARGTEQIVTLPTFSSNSYAHTLVFKVKLPARGTAESFTEIFYHTTSAVLRLSASHHSATYNSYRNIDLITSRFGNPYGSINHGGSIFDGEVHTIALVGGATDGSGTQRSAVYVDGALLGYVGTGTYSGLTLGQGSTLMRHTWGSLGDVLYYNRALSPEEVAETHTALGKMTCSPEEATTLEIIPDTLWVAPGQKASFEALAKDIDGEVIPDVGALWSSEDPTIAAIDQSGEISGISEGTVTITAELDDWLMATATAVVSNKAVVSDKLAHHWDPCFSYRTQEFVDIVGGKNGILGTTTETEATDPVWAAGEPMLFSERAVEQFVTLPPLLGGAADHTLVIRMKLPTRGTLAGHNEIFTGHSDAIVRLSSSHHTATHGNYRKLDRFTAKFGSPYGSVMHNGSIFDGEWHTLFVVGGVIDNADVPRSALYLDDQPTGWFLGSSTYNGLYMDAETFLLKDTWGGIGDVLYYDKALSEEERLAVHESLSTQRCAAGGALSITLVPAETEVSIGRTVELIADIRDESDNQMTGIELNWSSSDEALATVSDRGVVTGVSEGTVTISAELPSGEVGTASVKITERALVSEGLVSHWDPCVSHGTQQLVDVVGGMHGVLGTTDQVEGTDPSWESHAPLLSSARATEQFVTLPDFSSHSAYHTFIFKVLMPKRARAIASGNVWNYADQQYVRLTGNSFATDHSSYYTTTQLYARIGNSTSTTVSHGGELLDGKLHTVAVVAGAEISGERRKRVYLDGEFIGDAGLYYSSGFNGGSLFMDDMWGSIGDILYYNRDLSPEEVMHNHQALSIPRCDLAEAVSLTVNPDTLEVVTDFTGQLEAIVTDAEGNVLPGREVLWTTADSLIATVDSEGLVTGRAEGETVVTGTLPDGPSETTVVEVSDEAIPNVGLVARWDPCESHETQEFVDIVGGMNGVLGTTSSAEGTDPTWETTEPMLTSAYQTNQIVTLPTFESYAPHHTFIFRVRMPSRDRAWASGNVWTMANNSSYIRLTGNSYATGHSSWYSTTQLYPRIGGSGTAVSHGGTLLDNSIHTVALVAGWEVEGTERIAVYMDGELLSNTASYTTETALGIGARFLDDMWGSVSTVLYYDRAIGPEEIRAIHNDIYKKPCRDLFPPNASYEAAPNPAEAGTTVVEFDASESWDFDNWIVSWDWDFDDWSTGSGEKISRVFPSSGEYEVLLTVTDVSGLTDTVTQTIVVHNAPPRADFSFSPDEEVSGTTITFDASDSYDPDGMISSYVWDFGDGTTRTTGSATTTHSYGSAGTKEVTLYVVDNDGLSSEQTQSTLRRTTIGADSSAVLVTGLEAGDRVIMRDEADARVAMVYETAGSASITLPAEEIPATTIFVQDHLGADKANLSPTGGIWGGDEYSIAIQPLQKTVTVNSAPVAVAEATPNPQDENSTVTLIGSSSFDSYGFIASYEWVFGDGGTGTGANVSHVYTDPGTYTATLTVTDDMGVSNSASVDVIVEAVPPVSRWNFDPDNEHSGTTVSFDGRNSYDPNGITVSYAWDFDGNGTTDATTEQANHVYDSSGSYSASLTVTDVDGNIDTETKTVMVTLGPPPTANFDYSCGGANCSFTDLSWDSAPGSVVAWSWDFDGAGTSTNQNPSFNLGQDTTHSITLTVTDNDGRTGTITKPVTVSGTGGPPTADFEYECDGVTCNFYDQSTDVNPGSITAWSWNFGGDGTSAAQNPVHSFSAGGAYSVSLTVTDNSGLTNQVQKVVQITENQDQPPVASFTWNPQSPIAEETVTFSAVQSYDPDGVIVGYEWDFDNDGVFEATGENIGHAFPMIGVKPVTLKVIDDEGNEDTETRDVTVYAGAECNVTYSNFLEEDRLHGWRYTDVNGITYYGYAHDLSARHVKLRWGMYTPRQTFDAYGVSGAVEWVMLSSGDTIASGSGDPSWGVQGTSVQQEVEVTLPANPSSYTMYIKPVTYAEYDFSAQAFFDCGGTTGNGEPTADFSVTVTDSTQATASGTSRLVRLDASASSDPDGDALSYQWDYSSNGSVDHTSTSPIREVLVNSSGTYTTTLYVTDGNGGNDNTQRTWNITVPEEEQNSAPTAAWTYSPSSPEAGQSVSFNGSASSDSDGSIASYAWNFGDGNTGTGATPNHTYSSTGTYTATLVVTDNEGATSAGSSKTISVGAPAPVPASLTVSDSTRTIGNDVGTATVAYKLFIHGIVRDSGGNQLTDVPVYVTVTDYDGADLVQYNFPNDQYSQFNVTYNNSGGHNVTFRIEVRDSNGDTLFEEYITRFIRAG